MTETELAIYKLNYSLEKYRGKSLLDWTRIWFTTSNDDFYELYGFNFNPHLYPGLYDVVLKEQEKKDLRENIFEFDPLRRKQ